MILEGILTTVNADGTPNISPMGPQVDERAAQGAELETLLFRPFQTSASYANLKRTGQGVFHVTDDVLLLAQAAVGRVDPPPPLQSIPDLPVPVLAGACRWYAVEVVLCDDDQPRAEIATRVVGHGWLRDFFGLNRAQHAVVEAAILATRLHLTGKEQVLPQYDRLQVLVDKTGGPREQQAMLFLRAFVAGADGA